MLARARLPFEELQDLLDSLFFRHQPQKNADADHLRCSKKTFFDWREALASQRNGHMHSNGGDSAANNILLLAQ